MNKPKVTFDKMEHIKSYLDCLPNEILLKMFYYLSTYDVIKYCEAYPQHEYFLREEKIIRTLDFSMELNLEVSLMDYLDQNVESSYVTVFNVNGLYWIPAEELRSCIKQFTNLECLCVLDTNMHVTKEDGLCLSSLHKIKRVAISMNKLYMTQDTVQSFPAIKSLMLYLMGDETYSHVEMLTSKLRTEDLWIISKSVLFNFPHETLLGMGLKRFVYQRITPCFFSGRNFDSTFISTRHPIPLVPSFNYINIDCDLIHTDRTYGQRKFDVTIYDEHFQGFYVLWSSLYDILPSWYNFLPIGVDDMKMLLRQDPSYCIKQLLFNHLPLTCSSQYCYAVAECLNSHLARNLQKLSFKCCFLGRWYQKSSSDISESDEEEKSEDNEATARPKLIGHPLNQVGENFPNLTELEIFQNCWNVTANLDLNYETISNLKYLQKLTLCVLRTTHPKFIIKVLQKCTELRVLKIDCIRNGPFMESLSSGMKFTKKLKDFRCEVSDTRLNMDRVFEELNKKDDSQLERIALIAEQSDISNRGHIAEFLKKNPQLVFVCLVIKDMTEELLRKIDNDLKTYKIANTSTSNKKIFIVTKSEPELANNHLQIPEVHFRDMWYCPNNVLTGDIYNDFMFSNHVC